MHSAADELSIASTELSILRAEIFLGVRLFFSPARYEYWHYTTLVRTSAPVGAAPGIAR